SRASCERVRGTLDRLADSPPHPETLLRLVSDLSPQAGRGEPVAPAHTPSRSRRVKTPELCQQPPSERAQGMPGARCTRSLACKSKIAHEVVTTGSPEQPGIPRAMVLTAYFVISPVIGLFCHRRLANMAGPRPVGPTSPPQSLTPASRRQDHTTSPSATTSFVCAPVHRSRVGPRPAISVARRRCRVHRIPCPTSVTIAKRPFVWDGMAGVLKMLLPLREAEYFCEQGWT